MQEFQKMAERRQLIMNDNYDLWKEHDRMQEEWRQRRPKCICCGENIQEDTAVQIRGDYYCDKCIDDMRVYLED